MTTTTYSNWPEAAYALSLTKHGNWHAQRATMELLCAHAFAQGSIVGELECSERDLAAHLYRSASSGVGSAGEILERLVARRILRPLVHRANQGSGASIWRVWHWTRWEVPWRLREATIADRMTAFSLGQIRAQEGSSARVYVRALTKSARVISAEIDALARGSMDPRASDSTLPQGPWSERREPRATRDPSLSFQLRDFVSLDGEREQALIEGIERVTGRPLYGQPRRNAAKLAGPLNGAVEAFLASLVGVRSSVEAVERLRVFVDRPLAGAPPAAAPRPPTGEELRRLEEEATAAVDPEEGRRRIRELREKPDTL